MGPHPRPLPSRRGGKGELKLDTRRKRQTKIRRMVINIFRPQASLASRAASSEGVNLAILDIDKRIYI